MNKINGSKAFGILLAVFSVFIWGITFVSTKYLLNDFNAIEILFFRFILAYLVLWILNPKPLILKDIKKEADFALAGLSGVFIYQLLENLAINYTNASNVSIIVSICPVFTALTAMIFLRQKTLTWNFVLGFFIAIIGVALVSFNGVVVFDLNPKGDFLALGAGICWGFYSLFVSRINASSFNQVQSTRRIFMYALIFMMPLMIAEWGSGRMSLGLERFTDIYNVLNFIFLGAVASGLCFVFWNKACSILGTVHASVGIYLIPVVTFVFAFIFLKEHLSVMGVIGALCTVSGVVLSSSLGKKRKESL